MKSKQITLFLVGLITLFFIQFLLPGSPAVVTALPPRPTATAVPIPEAPKPKGGQIVLHVVGQIDPDHWTWVQWQDANGQWHDVAGWQGTLDPGNLKTWWVGAEDLGKGPFRWLVQVKGETAVVSEPFFLPTTANPTAVVTVLLE